MSAPACETCHGTGEHTGPDASMRFAGSTSPREITEPCYDCEDHPGIATCDQCGGRSDVRQDSLNLCHDCADPDERSREDYVEDDGSDYFRDLQWDREHEDRPDYADEEAA